MLERRHGHGRGQDEAVDGHQGEAGAGHGEDDERPEVTQGQAGQLSSVVHQYFINAKFHNFVTPFLLNCLTAPLQHYFTIQFLYFSTTPLPHYLTYPLFHYLPTLPSHLPHYLTYPFFHYLTTSLIHFSTT